MKFHIELLHPVVHHLHLIIAYHPTNFQNKITTKTSQESKWGGGGGGGGGRIGGQRTEREVYSFMRSISRRLLGEDIAMEIWRNQIRKVSEISPPFFFFLSNFFLFWVVLYEREEMRKAQWKGTKER